MDHSLDDSYGVYVRSDDTAAPDDMEQLIANCTCYEDAVRAHRASGHVFQAVIRYHGDVGGGD
jgi:hypothetical protein